MFRRMLVMLMLLIAIPVALTRHPAFAASGRTFYVDCLDGNDSSTGLSQSLAWKTMSKANKSLLVAGDSLLFKRGCTWTGTTLTAHWSGTASAPVTIGTYGTDARLAKVADASISVTGVYQVVEGFEVTFKPVKTAACGQPLGQYYALVVTQGGSNNTIQHNLLTHATAGIHISKTAGTYNKVYYNTLAENNVMQEPFDGSGDLGAWGMLVRGSHTDIAYNTFLDNRAVCTFGKYFASNSVEIYEGDFNNIHHNVSQNDRVFSELGGSSTNKASDNTYSFNLVVSNLAGARFITTRGALDTSYGPVYRTVAERNTVFFSGVGSQGMVCSLGCSSNILTARYNIIQAEEKGVYFDQTMGQKANMYWSSTGTAKIQDGGRLRTVGPSSTAEIIVANPSFADPTNGNFRLRSASPAVDAGGATGFQTDLDQAPSIAGVAGDIGGYEFQPPPPPPATTVAPPLNTASATSMSPATLGQGSTWRTVKLTGTGFEA
ncbi:MAG TPA: choice-of-anchor Q domain-containing protein, partial [Ilumatobacteraceae bacterium]